MNVSDKNAMIIDGWNKQLTSTISHDSKGYVHLVCVRNVLDSRESAIEWDNAMNFDGWFYYRDWTKSGMPWLDSGEKYWSGFWFEKLEDAKEFQSRYGGVGDWVPEYQAFVDTCNAERNS